MEDLTGKQFGPYRIVAPLGEGGMAAVYKAFQPGVDRFVALKVLPQHYAKDPQFVDRFEREAKVLAKLQHPHILPVHDFGQVDGGYTYIVMPFIESGDLAELMTNQQLSLAEIGRMIGQIGDALDYAHTQEIVHRDVKPSNVLVDGRGNCLLSDFGLAKIVSSYANKLTGSGFLVGTPEYMAPEQGLGETVDGRSDIYALGVVLYELVVGRVPFSAETPVAVILKHVNDPLPLPRTIDPTLPEVVERVILKALAKNPEDRYPTPGDMVKALQATIQGVSSFQQSADIVSVAKANEDRYAPLSDKLKASQTAVQTASSTQQNGDIISAKNTPDKSRPANSPIRRVQPKSAPATAKPLPQSGSGQMILWGALSFLLVTVIGLVLLGVWQFSQPGQAEEAAPAPTQAQQSPVDRAQLELPQATSIPITQPQIELPPATPTLLPTPVPTAPQAPAGHAPPPEAIEACRGAAVGVACTANLPGGAVTGTCQIPPGQQLACIPAGGPPPPGP